MRLAVKRTHAVVSARLAASANTTVLLTALPVEAIKVVTQTVRVSPTVFLGKSTAINLIAVIPLVIATIAVPVSEENQ